MLRVLISLVLVALAIASLWQFEGRGLVSVYLQDNATWSALLLFAVLYAVLLAIPFVPGTELGWLIIALFGTVGILVAWFSTVIGLALSYWSALLLGRHPVFARLMQRRQAMCDSDPAQLALVARILQRCLRWQERYPCVFVLVTLNVPGNLLIGGGGGIAWLTAVTPGVRFSYFIVTATVGTAVVPLVLLAGSI